jgi:hypothetical protein
MSDQKVVSIKYSVDEIFACKDENCLMPKELEEYCVSMTKSLMSILAELVKPMDDINKSHMHGVNPNDISLKQIIRENLNKLNQANYKVILEELKALNYTSETHFAMLAAELIVKSMNDVAALKNVEASKKTQKTSSELYAAIASEFTNYFIKQGTSTIKFKSILTKECQVYFEKFTDIKERMDQNNPHKVSNYKGFMNMIGYMYSIGLFPKDIIKACSTKIIKLMTSAGLPKDDCDNYYAGYDRLINRVLCHFERTPILPHMIPEFNTVKDIIKEMNDKITKICDDEKIDKADRILKTGSVLSHRDLVHRFQTLCESYKAAEDADESAVGDWGGGADE